MNVIFYVNKPKDRKLTIGLLLKELTVCSLPPNAPPVYVHTYTGHKYIDGKYRIRYIRHLLDKLGYSMDDNAPSVLFIPETILPEDGVLVEEQVLIKMNKKDFKKQKDAYKAVKATVIDLSVDDWI